MIHSLFTWFLHVSGSDNVSGPWYGFWSGFGSDLGEVAMLGAVVTWYRHYKCISCWRVAHHKVEGTHYKTCHKHLTLNDHEKIRALHKKRHPEQHLILKTRRHT